MTNYIAFDTETGGINPEKSSLLTAYFAILNENLNVVDELSLALKPNDGIFKVTAEALSINKLDIVQHSALATEYQDAIGMLVSFLSTWTEDGKYKLTPIAHNIDFDLGFIWKYLTDKEWWEKYVSYRKLDTAVLANFFKTAGVIGQNQKTGLGDLAKLYDISFETAAHDARSDVGVMIEVLKVFKSFV